METAPKHRGSWKEFLKRKQINFTVQTYFIDALGAMAFGLFASLLIGTIFSTIGEKTGVEVFNTIASYAKGATGAALGVSIAYALKAPQLVLFSAATVGIASGWNCTVKQFHCRYSIPSQVLSLAFTWLTRPVPAGKVSPRTA